MAKKKKKTGLLKKAKKAAHRKVTQLNTLKMTFDPNTIEHLGVKMYSNIPNAIAELIANAYDADASKVKINLVDFNDDKQIIITDNGYGMSFDEINSKFLRIGRKKRVEDNDKSPSGKRKVTGRKGLGKLAFFGIGNQIEIITIKKKSAQKITFTLSWDEIINSNQGDYKPKYSIEKALENEHGTQITLKDLKRKTDFDQEGLAVSLSKLFNLFDNTFLVDVLFNGKNPIRVDDKLKYQNIIAQFEWPFPKSSDIVTNIDFEYKKSIFGKIITTEKPLKPGQRGITLFAHGRLVNAPEFFGISESSHGYSYMTGWLDIDFVDEWADDVISTDRQSLNWDLPPTIPLRNFLKKVMGEIEKDWSNKRSESRRANIKTKTNVDVDFWYSTLPLEILNKIEPMINNIIKKSELPPDDQITLVQQLHSLVPEYPYYHWRNLHDEVRNITKEDYTKSDYLRAAGEAAKLYIKNVQKKSGLRNKENTKPLDGLPLMQQAFGISGKLKFTPCSTDSEKDLEEGQKSFAMGIVAGFRNPVQHENKNVLYPSVFNDKDCLDILSLISFLFKKLDHSKSDANN